MNYSIQTVSDIIKAVVVNTTNRPIDKPSKVILLTDSRSLTFAENTLFFALSSVRDDGHKYIAELYTKGVRSFVIDQLLPEFSTLTQAVFLHVPKVLVALQQLATYHRSLFSIPVIGITGSNGKTVVKEWAYQLLRTDYQVTRSPRSYNSQIGVPLSVWELTESTELAMFEAGISEMDEMSSLSHIIKPTIGIFTHLGTAHKEHFISQQLKCKEKLKLFKECNQLIYCLDDPILADCIEEEGLRDIGFTWSLKNKRADLLITSLEDGRIEGLYRKIKFSFDFPYTDAASIENTLHCVSLLLILGVPIETLSLRIPKLEPIAMRLEVKQGERQTILINDSYNSDLASLQIAIDFMARQATEKGFRKTVILSDILQTGYSRRELYLKVAESLRHKNVDRLIAIGYDISEYASVFTMQSQFYPNTETFLAHFKSEDFEKEAILIKGSRSFHFERITEKLEKRHHTTILEVNLDSIVANLNTYRELLPEPTTRVICMLKAFGYGCGSIEVAKTLQHHRADYLAVAVVDEGVELRQAGITMPIMVMNPEMGTFATLFEYNLEPEVYSFKILDRLLDEASRQGIRHYPIHIKIDTGMSRLGFELEDVDSLIAKLQINDQLQVKSVFSHLVGSDDPSLDSFTHQQVALFYQITAPICKAFSHHISRHILNSAGIERFPEYAMDMVRLGIGLYGVSANGLPLKVVNSLKTNILQIREVSVHDTVGYGRRGHLLRDSRIAALPIGYADGIHRSLGNGALKVWVNGRLAPTVGSICMDVMMIDVTGIPCMESDCVEIFGVNHPVEEVAISMQSIPYEVFTSISPRVQRIYFHQ